MISRLNKPQAKNKPPERRGLIPIVEKLRPATVVSRYLALRANFR
jgi:hypothetical protein